jgi:hypothetical protein
MSVGLKTQISAARVHISPQGPGWSLSGIAVIDVPAVVALWIAAAGELGHALLKRWPYLSASR